MSISFRDFQNMHRTSIQGRARKLDADIIMDATFDNDIQYMIAYFYDYYHDDERLIYKGLHPEDSQSKVPIEIKYITHSHNSESKDQVGYYIQFKTTQENPIDYYDEYVKKWDAEFPIGLVI